MSNEILPNGTRVKASKNANFDEHIIGIIDGFSPHAGPTDSPDNSFYYVQQYTDIVSAPNILITPHVIPDPLYQYERQDDRISVDQYWNGIPVQAVVDEAPIDGILSGQLVLNEQQVFIIKYFSEKLGMYTQSPFTHVRLAPGQPIPAELQTPIITNLQLYGLLTQLTNLINNRSDTAAAMRSVANLYNKADEVLSELEAIRNIIKST